MPVRLTQAAVKAYREARLREQGGRCALTGYTLSPSEAVLDHCHTTGHVRGVIGRGVNALLGKIENNYKRYGVSLPQVHAMGKGLESYLSTDCTGNPYHYTHRTDEEKRERTNKLARQRRATKKAQV